MMNRWILAITAAVLAGLSTLPQRGEALSSIVLASAAWACVLWVVMSPARRRRGRPPGSGAAWASWQDVAPLAAPGPFLLGLWPGTRARLYLGQEQFSGHVLVLGPSRSGKTAGVIAPNVLLRDPTRESTVVLDVKTGARSLWNITAGRYGPQAHLFCPLFEGSVPYNPLEEIDSIGAAQRKAWLLVLNTTPRSLSGDARVYAAASADLAALLFLYVQQDRHSGGHTVGAVFRLLMGGSGAVREALRGSRIAAVRERAGLFAARERRVQDAAVTGLLERLAPWADPLINEATARHWDLRTLGREASALYVLLPEAESARLHPLVAWLVADLLDGLIDEADRTGLRVPVRIFLDEFARFGYLVGLSDRLPTLRERGVSVLMGAQVASQIEEVYGWRGARSLIGNTETKLIFRAGDLETARMVSAWLGQTSVPEVSVTTRGRRVRSMTVHPRLRPLMPVEEMTRLPEGAMIALSGAFHPCRLQQARYFEEPRFEILPPPFPLRPRSIAQAFPITPAGEARPTHRIPAPRPAGGVAIARDVHT